MKPLMRYAMMRVGDERRNDEPESRFRDRTGREHYDNGRFAPMRSAYDDGNVEQRNYPYRMADVDREPPRMGYGMPYMGMAEPMRGTYDRPAMGYGEPARMNYPEPVRMGDDEDYRRKWTITENNGASPQYRGERNADGMTRIYGFGGNETMRYEGPSRVNEMEHRRGAMERGYGNSDAVKPLDKTTAHEWTKSMHNEDGSTGEHWSMDQTNSVLSKRGYNYDPVEWYAILNAMFSDYYPVAKKHGLAGSVDFYADMANAWLSDKDAVDDKAAVYFAKIVKH